MKRRTTTLLSVILLAAALIVGCSQNAGHGDGNVTEFYATARKALQLSTGVALPDLSLDLDKSDKEAYDAEMEELNGVIAAGGSHDFNFDFNKGVTWEAYVGIVSAVTGVFGNENEGYPVHQGAYDINLWTRNGVSVMVKYTPKELISIIIYPNY